MDFLFSNGSTRPSYKAKLRQMQKLVRRYVILNAALCDQVSETQEQLVIAKENRRFLLERLQRLSSAQQESAPQGPPKSIALNLPNIYPSSSQGSSLSLQEEDDLIPMPLPLALPPALSLPLPMPTVLPTALPTIQPAIVSTSAPTTVSTTATTTVPTTVPLTMGASLAIALASALSKKRPKPNRAAMMRSKPSDFYQPGSPAFPIFPMTLRGLTVYSVGTTKDYETKEVNGVELLVPIDFHSVRIYGSISDPETRCRYDCRVHSRLTESRMFCQRFEISSRELDVPIGGQTADVCHNILLNMVNGAMGAQVTTQPPKGEWFFGYALPAVRRHIKTTVTFRKTDSAGQPIDEENDDSLHFEALQRSIAVARFEAQASANLAQAEQTPSPQHWEV